MYKPIRIVDSVGRGSQVVNSPDEAILNGKVRLISRVLIVNKGGQIILQKRAKTMRSLPGRWDSSASGHVDINETPHQAAQRELSEEIGIDCELREIDQFYQEVNIEHQNDSYLIADY